MKRVRPKIWTGGRRLAAGRSKSRVRPLHIHLINSPDSEPYWIPPDHLSARLAAWAVERRLNVTVTESRDADAVTPEMRGAHVLVGFQLPRTHIRELPELRCIHLVSAGADHLLPLDWLPGHVVLTNSSGVHSDLAGEYAACALLMLNIGIPQHVKNQRRGHWDQVFNTPIRGKTVVFIGVGAIGGSAARHAKRLGLYVIGIRRTRRPHRYADEVYGPAALSRILPRADFVLVTAPLTPKTRGMIGRRELDLLKPGAGIVNMSRAALVDYQALAAKLTAGSLRGAIVDVCDPEPLPPDSPLWHTNVLIITPHISSDPVDYTDRTMAILEANLRRLMSGRPLRNRIEPTRGY
jgi:glyoxylate/hydroxypyruvate reductase